MMQLKDVLKINGKETLDNCGEEWESRVCVLQLVCAETVRMPSWMLLGSSEHIYF